MGVREYDPALGRFVSVDPLKGTVVDPQQRNRYTYTSNNPLVRYDLNGLYWGESYVDAAVGTGRDYLEGGMEGLQNGGTPIDFLIGGASANWDNWSSGYGSMSTNEQIALWALPAVPAVALGAVYVVGAVGTGGAISAMAPGTGGLAARLGIKCFGTGSKASSSARIVSTTSKQVQQKFKHAPDFGVTGSFSKANADKFSIAINQHVNSPGVNQIQGTYRGEPVIHHLNPNTGLNVITDQSGNFISGWRLGTEQLMNVMTHGGLT